MAWGAAAQARYARPMTELEREFMGGKRSKIWTYLILFGVLIVGVLVANFALSNPDLAKNGVDKFLGLPGFAFPIIIGLVGFVVYWLGLKVETDWPEALGALMIAGSVAAGEIMIGWNKFQLGGMTVVPYIIPAVVFLVLLGFGMTRSR
jgi:hypothetical protein